MPLDTSQGPAVNSLLGNMPSSLTGFFAGQLMGQEGQNSAINASGALTANQIAQHSLDQARLDDPMMAAQRDMKTTDMSQSANSLRQFGQANKDQAIQADTEKQITAMSSDKLKTLDNHLAVTQTAGELIKSYGGADAVMNNSEAQAHIHKTLSDAGIKGIPAQVTPNFLKSIQAQSDAAINSRAFIQQTMHTKQQGDQAINLANVHGAFAIAVAQLQKDGAIGAAIASQPVDKQVVLGALNEAKLNGGAIDERSMTQVKSILMKELTKEDMAPIDAEATQAANAVKGKKMEDIRQYAKERGVEISSSTTTSESAMAEIYKTILTKGKEELVEKRANALFQTVLPAGVVPRVVQSGDVRKNAASTIAGSTGTSSAGGKPTSGSASVGTPALNTAEAIDARTAQAIAAGKDKTAAMALNAKLKAALPGGGAPSGPSQTDPSRFEQIQQY